MSGEPTLAESPVPLALGRLQPRAPMRLPKGLRTGHRPSLPLASLQESVDEMPRRRSDDHLSPSADINALIATYDIIDDIPPMHDAPRRASTAAFNERYTKIDDDDDFPSTVYGKSHLTPRRASVAVPMGSGSPGDKGRRRSWANKLQLERKKRRKSGGEANEDDSDIPPSYTRQKRPSWWNVLVPDNILKNRSRRASAQLLSRSAESIEQTPRRSKSRSVDHGFASPFDLDALRTKVEGRFDAVHKDEDEAAKRPPSTPPMKTTTYTVRDRDTLTSVAARFDTTPSELTKLNRLATPFIFPGQNLLVPDKRKDGDKDSEGRSESGDNTSESTHGGQNNEQPSEKDILDQLRPTSPEAPTSPVAPQRFLKINVRHITDGQGVVSGVLLVTPNAVMFDPNVSDTLVMEHGPESYGVIAPMEFVVNAAIYFDIAHMRTHDSDPTIQKGDKPEIYYMNKTQSSQDTLLVKDETFPELQASASVGSGDASGSECSCEPGGEAEVSAEASRGAGEAGERGGDAFPKAFDRELVTPTSGAQTAEERRRSLLDHHWAIPSKERMSIDNASEVSSTSGGDCVKEERGDSLDGLGAPPIIAAPADLPSLHLVKLSCHDSGIDIRDPLLHVTPTNAKKVYSDADIVLSQDWVPPLSIPPAEPPLSAPPLTTCGASTLALAPDERRKPASVSFSLDSSGERSHLSESPSNRDDGKGDKKNKVLNKEDILLSQDWVLLYPSAAEEARHKPRSVSFSVNSPEDERRMLDSSKKDETGKGDRRNKMLKRLSYPLTWMEGLTGDAAGSHGSQGSQGSQGDSLPTSADSHNSGSVFSKVFSSSPMNLVDFGTGLFLSKTPSEEAQHDSVFSQQGRSSLGGFGRSEVKKTTGSIPRLDYRSMVSVDDMPELFVPFDKLIPRPARPSDDPPLYLRLRMGRPIGRCLPRTTPLMSYGRKRMKPEYWFGVPRNRVDDLYKFLNHWVPELYGELGDVSARGYQLVDSDTEWDDEEDGNKREKGERSGSQGEVGDLTKESWELLKAPYVKIYSILKSQGLSGESDEHMRDEVLSMSDELRRALYSSGASVDMEFSPPDLIGATEILTMEHREKLCGVLPARAQGYMWSLVFSTSQHGFSLASMYRKMQRVDSPVLLVVQDTDNNVFGALTSCALHPSEHFYGTGESLLFSFTRVASTPEPGSPKLGDGDVKVKEDGDQVEKIINNNDEKRQDSEDKSAVVEEVPQVKTKFRVWQWTGDNMYFIRGSNDNISIGSGDGKFGLWLDGDLYLGRTQPCTTYGNQPLTTREDFIVKIMECWAFI